MTIVYLSCILQFCYTYLLVLVGFIDSTKWNRWMIMSVLFLPFQSECVFLFLPDCTGRPPWVLPIKVVGRDITLLSWTYRESMQSFTSRHEIICRFSIMCFTWLKKYPSIPSCWFFNWEQKLDFVRWFFLHLLRWSVFLF